MITPMARIFMMMEAAFRQYRKYRDARLAVIKRSKMIDTAMLPVVVLTTEKTGAITVYLIAWT